MGACRCKNRQQGNFMTHIILIISPEPVQRNLLSHSLQNRLGYRIMTAVSSEAGRSLFSAEKAIKPDLILHDWPGTGGDAAVAGLKILCAYAPVVALVKYGDLESAITALCAGAQDFLTKPVPMERISTTFRNLLLLRDARLEIERLRRDRMQEANIVPAAQSEPASFHFSLIGEDGNIRRIHEIEAESIRLAMQYYHGRMTEVARRLGIGRSTLYRKLGEIGIKHQEAA